MLIWDAPINPIESLERTIDRSKIQLAIARTAGDADSEEWAKELARVASEHLEALALIEAERATWALRSKSAKRLATIEGPLFAERGLFD